MGFVGFSRTLLSPETAGFALPAVSFYKSTDSQYHQPSAPEREMKMYYPNLFVSSLLS